MRRGASDTLFDLQDSTCWTEAEFELSAAEALARTYSDYRCFPFGGTFELESHNSRPDLALVARDLSHWFVVEVEIDSHSLERHVIPQVQAFSYGEPREDCLAALSAHLGLSRDSALTFLRFVPRSVAIVSNRRNPTWEAALKALSAQLIAVSVYKSEQGERLFELDGDLNVLKESLGFGRYSATDRSIIFPKGVRLPQGVIQIDDLSGAVSSWSVSVTDTALWLTKANGHPSIVHNSYLQLVRMQSGKYVLRRF